MKKLRFDEQITRLRKAAVPIVAIETLDQPATVAALVKIMNGGTPVILWDVIRGLTPGTTEAGMVIKGVCGDENPAMVTAVPSEMLRLVADATDNKKIPKTKPWGVVMMNAHRFIDDQMVSQGVANIRSRFIGGGHTLFLLMPAVNLPNELKQDVIVIHHPLPDAEEIREIIMATCEDAGMTDVPDIEKVVDTLIGLSAFLAEQTLATCLYRNSEGKVDIDRESLWERKCEAIKQTPGLSVDEGKENIDDLDGCDNVVEYLKPFDGQYRAVCLVDEMDKAFAGVRSDSSGVSQDQHGVWLAWMQDKEVDGIIFIGVPGSGKSAVAKAIAKYYGVPCVNYDMGAMRSKYVGESGAQTRQGLNVISAIGQDKVLILATCNAIAVLPPELRRRFTMGTFFFDSPSDAAKVKIWQTYMTKYGVTGDIPMDDGWTGAEIRQCCRLAAKAGISLVEASAYIVPVSVSAKDQIDSLRKQADGKFISAAHKGVYRAEVEDTVVTTKPARKFGLDNK